MSGFVGDLRAELVAAAERRERRRLRMPVMRPVVPAVVAAVAVAVAAIVLVEHREASDRPAGRPNADVRPLFGGSLEPGVRYGSVALVPAVSFTVGDDRWQARETESPERLLLERVEPRDAAGALVPARSLLSIARPTAIYEPGSPGPKPAPPDLVSWLRAHPDVVAGTPRRTRLAGLDFEVLDLVYRFSRPAHDVPRCRLQGFRCTSLGPGDFHPNGAVQRVYVRTTDPGPLVVTVEGSDAEAFREVERAARPLLDSLEVTRP